VATRFAARQEVARDLLDDELIVGQVAVDRADDPVAVEVIDARLVLLVAITVRVTRRVEPVTSPAFAVVRGGEESVGGIEDCGLRIAD